MIAWLKRWFSREDETLYHLFEVAFDFSRFPNGATREDGGDHSGEALCDMLAEELTGNHLHESQTLKPIWVFLDGTMGYGSSFLERAFGGLVSVEGFKASYLRANLKVTSKDSSLVTEIWDYIDSAQLAEEHWVDNEVLISDIENRLSMEGLFELVLRNPII